MCQSLLSLEYGLVLVQSALVLYGWFCRGGEKSVRVDAVGAGADADGW